MQAREQHQHIQAGKKLAKEVLEEFMLLCAGMASTYQPTAPGTPPNPNYDEERFRYSLEMTRDFAKALAPYQSPTFKALSVQQAPDVKTIENEKPKANVTAIDDPDALQRVYRQMITVTRG